MLLGVLGAFLIGPTKEKSILNFWINFQQAISFFIVGNLALGIYYLKKDGKSIKWLFLLILICGFFTIIWFSGFFQNAHF